MCRDSITPHRENSDNINLGRRDAVGALVAGGIGIAGGHKKLERLMNRRSRFERSAREDSEILIKDGRVVNADGVSDIDVRIIGEFVTEVGSELQAGPSARTVDASGKLVIPGGIDPHTHIHPPFVDDFTSGTSAALAGGITTIGTFAFPQEGENALQALDRVQEAIAGEAIGDVFLHAATWPPDDEYLAMMPELARRGQPSIKIFMLWRDFGAHLSKVIRLLESARDAGVVTLIHCEDEALLNATARRMQGQGRTSLRFYAESRPVVVEAIATQQAAALCESTEAPMQVVHLSSHRALQACRNSDTTGLPLFVEVRPMYLYLTEERLVGENGPLYVGQPPLRSRDDSEALWDGVANGAVDLLATDHAPWMRAQKLNPERTITDLRPGISSLQFMLPLFFSEGVKKRGISLERFVDVTSTKTARIMGLYPERGVIAEGAYADVVVFDPESTAVIHAENDYSNSDYSVYEGWSVTGWPVMTIRRGEVVYEDGQVVGQPGTGRLVSRRPWQRPT
jgi:dihydropyrimidinase